MEFFLARGKLEDVKQRRRFFLGFVLRLKNYVWWKIMLATTLEVEQVLVKFGETPFELLKE
jgi:hypothetical protein